MFMYCFGLGLLMSVSRLCMGFAEGETGWKIFTVAGGLLLVAALAHKLEQFVGVGNYFSDDEREHPDDGELLYWANWFARSVMLLFVLWVVFSIFLLASIDSEATAYCARKYAATNTSYTWLNATTNVIETVVTSTNPDCPYDDAGELLPIILVA